MGFLMLPGALRLRNSRYRRTALYDASVAGVVNMFLTHFGLVHFMGFLEWKALLTRTEPPDWAYAEK